MTTSSPAWRPARPAKVTTDGQDQAVPGAAVDNAGNTFTDNATVSIDTVSPRIGGAPGPRGERQRLVRRRRHRRLPLRDTLSGIASCPSPVTLGEGKDQIATGTATDAAGNSEEHHGRPDQHRQDGADPERRRHHRSERGRLVQGRRHREVDCRRRPLRHRRRRPGRQHHHSEGDRPTASTTVRDRAGNETSATSDPVKIDRTAPSTTVSDVSDWSNSAVTVKLTADDNLSGVAATHYQLDTDAVADGTSVTIDTEGVHTLQVWSVDVAGNVEAEKNSRSRSTRPPPTSATRRRRPPTSRAGTRPTSR